MKKLLSLLLISSSLVVAQVNPAEEAEEAKENVVFAYQVDIDNLTAEKRTEYFQRLFKAQTLFNQKRIFETLAEIDEVHQIYPNNPASLNVQGACYVEFRNFEKARAAFAQALKQHPGNANVLFNLAEISFVTHQWKESHDQFSALIDGQQVSSMRELIRFKILLCKIKNGELDEAKALTANTSFLDDSPLHYYANAAIEYSEDRSVKAEAWLNRCSSVFKDRATLAPWQDTLIEFGYLKSFYGGDLEVE